MIDGVLQSGGVNGILTSNILPNGSTVNVSLFVEDNSNGCIVQSTNSLNTSNPDYVAFNTSLITNPLESGFFDDNIGCFTYCSNDSVYIDTFFNVFNNTIGIDYVVIDNGFTQQTVTNNFDTFQVNLSESVSSISITTYFTGGCDSITVNYCILYNQNISGINVNFGSCLSSNLCIGDTVKYFIDPQQFQMSLNGLVHFVIKCDDNNIDTVTWQYSDFQQNTYDVDADCNPLTPDVDEDCFPICI